MHVVLKFWCILANTRPMIFGVLSVLLLSQPVDAAVSYIGQDVEVATSNSATSLTVTPASGTQEGDLLLAHLTVRSDNFGIPPSGWTAVFNLTNDGVRHQLWYRIVPTGGLGNQTFSFDDDGRAVLGVSTLRGADPSNPIAAYGSNSDWWWTATAPSVDVTTADSYALAYFAGDDGNESFTLATTGRIPAWSHRTTGGSSNGVSGAMWHFPRSSTGPSGSTDANYWFDEWSAVTVIIAPGTPFSCFADDFNRASGVGSDWAVAFSSGSFGSPQIINNRLRLTNASSNAATAATLQRVFPGAGNYVELEFIMYAYGGNGADGIAIILSDAETTPQPGGYGGSLGYAQRCGIDGFAGGWLGIGLDEYGNYSTNGECRVAGPGFRTDAIAVRGSGSGTSGYRYIAGTNSLSPGVDQNSSGHRYRIRIDARTNVIPVTVDRDTTGTGNNYSNLISIANIATATGQAALPENLLLSLTGSTGGSNNIHEIDNLGVCALQMDPITEQIDHFDFTPLETPLTCKPTLMRVRACMDANCTSTYNGNVSVNLGPSGWQGSQPYTLTNGIGEFYFSRTTIGAQTTFTVTNSSVPIKPFSQITCNGVSPCSIVWQDAGLDFNMPTLTSNKPSNAFNIRAVKKDDTTQSCAPAFTGSRTVSFYSNYQNPASGSAAMSVRDTSTPALTSIGQSFASRTPITLNFNNNGEAQIHAHYPDAGEIRLYAHYQGSAANNDNGLVLSGDSYDVAVPAGFCVEAMTFASPSTPLPSCDDANCPGYQRAGESFPLRISARAWQADGETGTELCDNLPTPNFRHVDFELTHQRESDSDLLVDGALGVDDNIEITTNGTVTLNNQTLSEAGRFLISTSIANNYFGIPLPVSSSAPIGRIYPYRYDITDLVYEAACDVPTTTTPFTYAGLATAPIKPGQLIPFGASIRAVNKAGQVLTNYHGAYAKLNGEEPVFADFSGAVAASDGDFFSSAELGFLVGISNFVPNDLQYRFNSPRAPYEVSAQLSVTDSDGATGSSEISVAREYRLGRLRVENAYGPEQLPLPIPLRAEYFDGTRYRQNAADNCTTYLGSNASLADGSMSATLTPVAGPSSEQTMQTGASTGANPLLLTAPGTGNVGSVNVIYTPPVWLQFDWNNDGSNDATTTGVATFGRYRGSDRVIYWREQRPPIIP
ncbi:DUF6701 domain-containing protein [Permianibacter aggregans]|uniref:MSHA biogenesis protein MshQ n=1 Tax=Permianibacter aggregans TaxID=1510150 RepID=A0A4R6UXY6_9GAMM|nr:DUF6701 domain-containing protein [Permianibacter aggregans]QGX38655.1 hypothetical protein E2H98_02860 [Permianibacter aggregans]TDQ50445.1 MSHA biogenesis protein MshQ [Permianibacter aggregans]